LGKKEIKGEEGDGKGGAIRGRWNVWKIKKRKVHKPGKNPKKKTIDKEKKDRRRGIHKELKNEKSSK